jgi:putative PEP-CTERM system histidine kinase
MSAWVAVLFWLAGITALVSGLLRLKTKEGRTPRFVFLLISLISAAGLASIPFFAKASGDWWISGFVFPVATFLPFLWLVFSFCFARENYYSTLRRWRIWLGISAITTAVFAVVSRSHPLVLLQADARGNPEVFVTALGKWYVILALLVASFVLINVESTYRAATGIYRRRLRPSFFTIALFFGAVIYSASSAVLKDSLSIRHAFAGAVISLFMFPSVGFYLRSYQLQKSGVFIKRQAVYSSVGIILIGLYLMFVGAIGKALQLIGADIKVFYSIIAAFLVIVLFISILVSSSLKSRLRKSVDKAVYSGSPTQYEEDLASFSEEISTTLAVSDLVGKLSEMLREKLEVERLWLYLAHPHMPVFYRVYPASDANTSQVPKLSGFADWLFRHGEAIEFEDLIERLRLSGEELPASGLPDASEVMVCLPLIAKQNLVGILFLGKRPSAKGTSFTHQEIQFISAVGNQFALAVLSARLAEELLAARQIESFHKFSTFVMHDLKNSVSMLSMLLQNFNANASNPEFQKSALVTIQGAIDRMRTLITKLRSSVPLESQALSDCSPPEIVISLRDKLGLDRLNGLRYEERLQAVGPVRVDIEALTGIVENLIVNAIEAMPNGGDLTVSVFESDGEAVIEVKDTGGGMDTEFIDTRLFRPFETTKKKGLGIGLYQSRDLLDKLGGRFRVTSRIGEGSVFQVILPRSHG